MQTNLKTVKQVSEISGVSVRTLHYYDDIGLLKPTYINSNGYRMYDDNSLRKLQSIMLFRELEFPLKEIKQIISNPNFDSRKAVAQQLKLLQMRRSHLDGLISLAKTLLEKENYMAFKNFDRTEIEKYAQEVKNRWGATDSYSEYAQKSMGRTVQQQNDLGNQLMDIFAQIGSLMSYPPDSTQVQDKIAQLQNFITQNYYTCTKDILKNLGSMYIADRRFKENIDEAGGKGAAEFVAKAIEIYCTDK